MAPRRDYGPPTRRSARQRSTSVSSAGEDRDAGLFPPRSRSAPVVDIGGVSARIEKPAIPRAAAKPKAAVWDAVRAIERIMSGDRAYILRLTHEKRAAIIHAYADREDNLRAQIERLTQERDNALAEARGKRSMHAEAAQARINEKMQEQAAQAAAATPKSQTTPKPQTASRETAHSPAARNTPRSTSKTPRSTSSTKVAQEPTAAAIPPSPNTDHDVQEQEVSITSATPLSAPQAQSTPLPKWRQYLASVGGLLSPFKRSTPAASMPADSTPTAAKRSAPEDEDDNDSEMPTTKRVRTEEPSPRPYAGPSAKDSRMPTSLSTINEFTEPGSSTFMEPTPSKPPQPRAPIQTPTARPLKRAAASLSEPPSASLSAPLSAFPSTPTLGPRPRRTIASVRAARAAANTPTSTPYAWERQETPKVAEPNADRRLQKMAQLRAVRKQLEDLQKDQDVIEMESHRRKRVKVDDLEYIPHNLPGDSEGTFRVPDWDSDEEMEVEESVPEKKNVFQLQAEQEQESEKETPKQVYTPATMVNNAEEVQQNDVTAVDEEIQEVRHVFNFPSVGLRPPGQESSPEEQEKAGAIFAAGFNEWKALRGLA